jgi:transposase
MNSETLFSMPLGLQLPWQVKEITFSTGDSGRSELHLRINFVPGSRFPDEANELCPVHDTVERQWQHLSFFEHTCYLHCAVPRIVRAMVKFVLLMSLGHGQVVFYFVIRSFGASLDRTRNAG